MNLFGYHIELYLLFILFCFLLAFLVQLFYYVFIFGKIITYKKNIPVKSDFEPVSVIITAKNEEWNLRRFLTSVVEQDYPDFEVIVVDDCSLDDTSNVLSEFKTRYQHLKITYITEDDKFKHGKKLAVTVGIKAAKNEWLLFTDADCKPVSKDWIRTMQQHFTPDNSIVLGYGGYFSKKSFLNQLIRFDTLFIALQYLTLAISGRPYMGVGRNLAYRKSLFFRNKGFANHYHILSGDDDLFINEVATDKNTQVEFSTESHTLSVPYNTLPDWFNQKRRHLKTGFYYNTPTKFILSTELFSRILFYFSFIVLLILKKELYFIPIGGFIFRMINQLIIYKYAMKRLNEKNLLLPSLLFDIILPVINFIIIITEQFQKTKK